MLGQNVDIKVSGKTLTIKVDLGEKGRPSSSGKTLLVASTGGNVVVDPNTQAKLGLNVFVPNPDYKPSKK